ncbi:hypothetical protein QQX13_12165 [Demequina sp. SYSU T00068]|uniref:hypothetical protein n=1 Tax=Demequina lignilytica TaxID=3051663 RepID=UPI0026113B05|nr:hypothetical protein [Demequina sp. SYSU T00068]MDN4491589.1 hypothetical protein [Demequina sp. SYSU T00068]
MDLNEPAARGIYRLESSSPTVYYVDARLWPPLLLRAPGHGDTSTGPADFSWVELVDLQSGPRVVDGLRELARDEIDFADVRRWVLRVESRHRFDYYSPAIDGWWIARTLEKIVRIDSLPEWRLLARDNDDDSLAAEGRPE